MNNGPLGLPNGSVRAMLAVMIVGCCMAYFFKFDKFPTEIVGIMGIVIGYYFTSRQNDETQKNLMDSQRSIMDSQKAVVDAHEAVYSFTKAMQSIAENDTKLIDSYAKHLATNEKYLEEKREKEVKENATKDVMDILKKYKMDPKEILKSLDENPLDNPMGLDAKKTNDIPTMVEMPKLKVEDLTDAQKKATAAFTGIPVTPTPKKEEPPKA